MAEETAEKVDEQPSEFFSDERRASQIRALGEERKGYEARIRQAESVGNAEAVETLKGRVGQVDDELKRIGDGGRTKRQRAATRS